MNQTVMPAPIWRRLAAAVYDGLLLLGLWMVILLIDAVVRNAAGLDREWHLLRGLLFVIGLAFFGWFWTHGGQTLGMRAWRLQLRQDGGGAVHWLGAAIRYAATLLCWSVALTPMLMRLPLFAGSRHAAMAGTVAVIALLCGFLMMRLDARKRGPQDWISRSEVVVLPKPEQGRTG
ncbi:MAG: RDD family protein [Nevskiales bacterium]|nr:RDD family protein [Nevskiales bacterium]